MADFPKGFLWGAATSSHQVEGNNHNDWTEWEKLGRVKNQEHSGRASGHFERYKEDFALIKELGHNAHRFSIEWSRIEPQPGRWNLEAVEHYRQVLAELKRLAITPMVTLWHFTNPVWVRDQGGWLNQKTIDDFGRYVEMVVKELGDDVPYWITINEPTVYTSLGYVSGYWPPQKKNYWSAWWAIRNMATAHRLATQVIHRQRPHAKVGMANNLNYFAPARPKSILDRGLVKFAEYWHNRWILNRTYDTSDFIGVNYYFHHPLRFKLWGIRKMFEPDPVPNAPRSDLDWTVSPHGLDHVLASLETYKLPIIITENGLADAEDRLRAQFIRDHVAVLESALQRGQDIRGYLHWSLLDNFEWREGFGPRFGLIEVDYPTMNRTPRPSTQAYRQLIERHRP